MTKFTEEVKNYIEDYTKRGFKLSIYGLLGWLVEAMSTDTKEFNLLTKYITIIIKEENQ